MVLALSVVLAIAGLGLILFGIGYSAVFLAARTMFNRAMASEVADMSKAYVENAIAKIKSNFVRKYIAGRVGTLAGKAAVSFIRDQLSSSIYRGVYFAGAGLVCIVGAFNTASIIKMIWP